MFQFEQMRWKVAAALVTFHLVALVAWVVYSWQAVMCLLAMYVITAIGITGGYHRLLTHDSFKTVAPVRWAFTLAGMTAAQGAPVEWIAFHRKHHQYSDRPEDPHSPHYGGFWWSHLLWMLQCFSHQEKRHLFGRYSRDVIKDPFLRFVSRNDVYVTWLLFSSLLIGCIGYLVGGWFMFWSFIAYGVFIRLILVYHVTWAVNSATHVWGYRNFQTRDQSKNLWWVGLLAFGEGWHNNHHHEPRSAKHGFRWWEIDLTYTVIWMLSKCGLAWDVKKIS